LKFAVIRPWGIPFQPLLKSVNMILFGGIFTDFKGRRIPEQSPEVATKADVNSSRGYPTLALVANFYNQGFLGSLNPAYLPYFSA
jgi:hypothetical protein